MKTTTKRLVLFAASLGVALTALGALGTAANAATDSPPGPSHSVAVAAYPPGPTVADSPPGPGIIDPET